MDHWINLGDWELDIETHLIHFSPMKAVALGYLADEIPAYVTYEFFIEKIYIEDFSKVRDLFLALILGKTDAFDVEYRTRTKQGGSKRFRESCKVSIRSETGKPLVATGVTWELTNVERAAVGDLDEIETNLHFESNQMVLGESMFPVESVVPAESIEDEALRVSDTLTQVSNRQGLFEKLKVEVDKSHQNTMFLSVSLCEIQGFSEINAVEGHIFGDYLLVRIADLLMDGVRENDTVGRYLADTFMVIFPLTPREIATELMKDTIETIETYAFGCQQPIRLPYVVKEYMGESLETFIHALETALSKVK